MDKDEQAKVKSKGSGNWLYSDEVKEHFFNPKNFLMQDEMAGYEYDAVGRVGSQACGDEMVVWLKIDPKTNKIIDFRWQTFGCGSAIASTSALSEMILENGGMTIDEAQKIKPQDIINRLGGLPAIKVHCSVLGDQALRAAIKNWKDKKTK